MNSTFVIHLTTEVTSVLATDSNQVGVYYGTKTGNQSHIWHAERNMVSDNVLIIETASNAKLKAGELVSR